jgi:hypothetical protein
VVERKIKTRAAANVGETDQEEIGPESGVSPEKMGGQLPGEVGNDAEVFIIPVGTAGRLRKVEASADSSVRVLHSGAEQ